jgi:phosphatidylinositol glycan class V
MKLTMEGLTFEHEWVFCPIWWRIMNFIKLEFNLQFYDVLLLFTILNNLLIICITKLIYLLIFQLCELNAKNIPKGFNISKFAYIASLLVLVQPSGIFSTTIYSETPVQFLTYFGLYIFHKSRRNSKIVHKLLYLSSGIIFSLAFGIRSNSLLYGIIYVYDLTQFKNFKDIICTITTGSFLFISLIYSTYLSYIEYCPTRGAWCDSMTKSLVSYAQSHYWNNGFLNYFTMNNIPMFIIAAPQLIIILQSIWMFKNWIGCTHIILISVIYWIIQFTSMHVQIVNRVSTFIPIHIFYVSFLLNNESKYGKIILRWWIVWMFVQTSLFAAFLPPA